MDFWTHQEEARRKTARLITVYIVLVIALALLAGYAIDLLWREVIGQDAYPVTPQYAMQPDFRHGTTWQGTYSPAPSSWYDAFFSAPFYCGALGLLALTGIFCLCSPASLSSGGKSVAESLNGMLIPQQTRDPGERRLLNVVEEMALASGMSVPPVYVLKNESGINAFAAGCTINDAVIGVTQGALTHLTRDELQAVIGHEFSHIRNGDMKLDLRFVQLLFGLMCLADFCSMVMRSFSHNTSRRRDRDSNKAVVLLMLVVLIVYIAGGIMAFAGKLVQRAVNRQREFLADASSVQFTRNTALASALKKIGGLAQGSRLYNTAMTGSFRHLFFCSIHAGLFDSHPPLATRIRRIDPHWDGKFIVPGEAPSPQSSTPDTATERPNTAGHPTALLRNAGHEPLDASYLALALLLDRHETIQARQLAQLPNARVQAAVLHYKHALDTLTEEDCLALIEQTIPALKTLSPLQFEQFHALLTAFIYADTRVLLKEWLLYQLIIRQVGAQYVPRPGRHGTGSHRIAHAAETVLTALASLSSGTVGGKADRSDLSFRSEGISTTHLDAAMTALSAASDREKAAFMQTAARLVTEDNTVVPEETLFLRVLSLCLGRPSPLPMNGTHGPTTLHDRPDDPWAAFRSR